MNLVLLPLWMASGAVFPATSSVWLQAFMKVNPMTYGVAGIRRGLFPQSDFGQLPALGTSLLVLAATGLALYGFSAWAVEKSKVRNAA